ncbi:hypothetical protein KP509_22G060900 [Ceratopteris richardii]|uniref:Glutathione S-transferase 3, mitochondrial n=1 Tax=Ceratopteris richardii TaxID=49495 RepID=A0A8T2S7P0_CERRI|nr:hypothetical protein KP509_22G060900 [Ceratopteris richardii]
MSLAQTLPSEFGYVILTAAAGVLLTQWQGIQVGKQRKLCGLKYPKMYEDKDRSVFNCYQRVHQNTLESFPAFLLLLFLGGLAYPLTSSIFGSIWIAGRIVYSLCYYSGDPRKRMKGMWHTVGLLGLFVTTCVFGFRLVLKN